MKKPLNDLKKYKTGVLKNKIKYILIEESDINNSSVIVMVKAGSYHAPKGYDGLAHFLEHMLFLGSKKYPEENYFSDKLTKNGGFSNAFTDSQKTMYYFNVHTDYLEEMIDIFSHFFIDPLFDKNSVKRELNAIHSEHQKNINSDVWIIDHFLNILAKKDSHINQFETGSKDTLNKPNIRKKMIEFYNNFYCSDNITVAINSNLKLKKLNQFVGHYFGLIKSKKSKEIKFKLNNYSFANKYYHIKSIRNIRNLYFVWEIEPKESDKINKSWNIITFIINDIGLHSFETFLKSKSLINNLYSSVDYNRNLFIIEFDLTKKCDVNLVIKYLNYFLEKIKSLDWEKIGNYLKKTSKLLFNYGEMPKGLDLLEHFMNISLNYPIDNLLASHHLFKKINVEDIMEKLFILDIKKACTLFFNNRNFKINYQTDKHYKFKYGEVDLKLPIDKKSFILKFNFDSIFKKVEPKYYKPLDKFIIPTLISKRVWYGALSKFKEPIVYSTLLFSSTDLIDTPKKYLIVDLTCKCINYYLSIIFANEFKLRYLVKLNINQTYGILMISITGFNHLFKEFFEIAVDKIKNLTIEKNIFKNYKNIFKTNIEESNKINSWEFLDMKINEMINKYDYDSKILLKELEKIKYQDIKSFHKKIFTYPLTLFFYGNIPKKYLPNIEILKNNLNQKLKPNFKFNKLKNKAFKHPHKKEKNNCLLISFYLGKFNPRMIIKLYMIELLLQEEFYDKLRTKKQLGYLVNLYINSYKDYFYLDQKIQSLESIKNIENNIDKFNKYMYNTIIKELTNKDLIKIKEIIEKQLKDESNTLFKRKTKYLSEIIKKRYLFNSKDLLLRVLPKIKKDEIIELYESKILKGDKIKISVEGNKN